MQLIVSQSRQRGYISQGLSGSETSLISAYSFNNSINDLNTTNANNLTANGSAVATNADSPFGTQASGLISSTLDYAIIQSATFSTNTTVTVQVPEGCTIPTSGGVSAVSYSTQKAPYGFPAQEGKWTVATLYKSQRIIAISAITNWSAGVAPNILNVPTGAWEVGINGCLALVSSVSGTRNGILCLASAQPTTTSPLMPAARPVTFTGTFIDWSGMVREHFVHSTMTTYNMYSYIYSASGSESWAINGTPETYFYAKNAYL